MSQTINQKNAKINFIKHLTNEAIAVLSYGGTNEMLATMEALYKDAFLYQVPGADDYNMLPFEDREAINELHTLVTAFLKTALKYDDVWQADKVMINKEDAENIAALYDNLSFGNDVYIKLLDLLIVTSILYKPIKLGIVPTTATAEFYFFCTQIKELFTGYISTTKPAKLPKAA